VKRHFNKVGVRHRRPTIGFIPIRVIRVIRGCTSPASGALAPHPEAERLPYNAFFFRGLRTNSPPQFGQTAPIAFVQGAQNVHSWVQM
jgi:hypothetical protein